MQKLTVCLALALLAGRVPAHDAVLDKIVVEGRKINLIGAAVSASEGVVGQTEINIRPLPRTGEVLELIPGMVVTQHSGSGKANQYFLRGFNLDHGTDFATFVDGMPVNMRSHGHGQGYTDVSFLIPEAIATMTYQKGAYYADIGDFSGAGGVKIATAERLGHNLASLGVGEKGHRRGLILSGFDWWNGHTVLALENHHYDGPWTDIDEDLGKTNVLLKYGQALGGGRISIALMGYDNAWNSADQIPARAVEQGVISELGSIDDTVGGESSRYSLSVNAENGALRGSAYAIGYALNLWSNFTYFLDDEANGDQFEQVDDRRIYGGQVEYAVTASLGDMPMNNRLGLQTRVDDIQEVGLYQTQSRRRLGVTRSDQIDQASVSAFWENRVDWNHHWRTVVGLRYDNLNFDVTDSVGVNRFGVDLSGNGGQSHDDLLSLKGSLIYWINGAWETYLSAGQGFHSNDARGTTITVDPSNATAVDRVDPLVRSEGFELGARGFLGEKLNVSAALWSLQLDSELLFVGDAGNTQASAPSRRQGLELVAYYRFTDQISADLEYAYTHAEFDAHALQENHIPGAVRAVLQAGVSLDMGQSWFGSLRYRYFGERPLIEDDSVQSDGTQMLNLRLGLARPKWQAWLDVINITDRKDHDIDYFYASRLPGEPSGVGIEDIHFHPLEPRSLRVAVEYKW
ncbi:MAG: TonB-dependent receptor [Panacagrimonas sp.]